MRLFQKSIFSISPALSSLALSAVLALGCGSSSFSSSPGTGTQSLRVDASISASEKIQNAQTADQFSTDISVQVSKAGSPVTNAVVVIGSPSGPLTLVTGGPAGTYRGNLPSYQRSYTLEVTAGADNILGVQLDGPEFHVITAPTSTTNQRAGELLTAVWSPGGAAEATVETEKFPETATQDSGSFQIPGTFLTGEAGKLKEDRVRIRRTNRTNLAGGTAGSSLSVRIRNEVKFLIDGR